VTSSVLSGVGIHSGRNCGVRLHRVDGPLRFRRAGVEIPAVVDAVVSADRCVTLASGSTRVATVEHLLAALAIAGFWSGVLIEVDGEELPILDGSARPWAELVDTLGDPPEAPEPIVPSEPTRLEIGSARASIVPGVAAVDVSVDFEHPAIGAQRWQGDASRWPELLAARTFGFLAEFEALRSQGLASGADLGNAIVFDDSGPLGPLRYDDEPVRHKALDLLGDLALLGRPVRATVRVNRGSHRLHVNLMRQLLADPTTKAPA
jgi:UDP-3-O-[3-hydroxymyristoyl] N-acetylglucosamine deacetylase